MASKSEIIDAIEALAVHCRPPLMSIEQRELWMRDWCADLAEFPTEAVATACRKWRHSGSIKFPTAGQLLPLVRDSLEKPRAERIDVWRPATEAEYAGMTIREKIREHTILAHDAAGRAGPMFRNTSQGLRMSGVHLAPEEMPDSHHRWREEAKRHNQEIRRLRQYLSGKPLAIEAAE